MKKLLLLCMLSISFTLATAQDYKKVQNNFLLGRMEEAKTEVDKLMTDPKAQGKAEAFFWRAKVYASLYRDTTLRKKYPEAMKEAETALAKYAELDPAFAQVKEKGADPYFDIYSTAFGLGVKLFNDKKWLDAAQQFESAIVFIDLIIKNKWTSANIAFDTTSLLYTGYAYQNAAKYDLAAKYYGRLADNKVSEALYVDVYKFLVQHYTEVKNEEAFYKYLAIAKGIFPKEAWDDYEVEYMDKNYDLAKKTSIYDTEDAAGTMSENKYLQFGDLFVNVKSKEKANLDSAKLVAYTLKAAEAFKKAYAKNSSNAVASFNVGVIYYNIFGEYDDKYGNNIRLLQDLNREKSSKPAEKDPKKKAAAEAKFKEQTEPIRKANADLEKPINENIDIAIEWLEKSFTTLKDKTNRSNTERSVINKTVDFLANLYAYKRDKVRGKDSKVFDAYEAKFKEYDALHAKY